MEERRPRSHRLLWNIEAIPTTSVWSLDRKSSVLESAIVSPSSCIKCFFVPSSYAFLHNHPATSSYPPSSFVKALIDDVSHSRFPSLESSSILIDRRIFSIVSKKKKKEGKFVVWFHSDDDFRWIGDLFISPLDNFLIYRTHSYLNLRGIRTEEGYHRISNCPHRLIHFEIFIIFRTMKFTFYNKVSRYKKIFMQKFRERFTNQLDLYPNYIRLWLWTHIYTYIRD